MNNKHPFQVAFESAEKGLICEGFTASDVVNKELKPIVVSNSNNTVSTVVTGTGGVSSDGLIEEMVQACVDNNPNADSPLDVKQLIEDCYERMAVWFFLAAKDATLSANVPFKLLFADILQGIPAGDRQTYTDFFDSDSNFTGTFDAQSYHVLKTPLTQQELYFSLAELFIYYGKRLTLDGDNTPLDQKTLKLLQAKNRLRQTELTIGIYIQSLSPHYFADIALLANSDPNRDLTPLRQTKIQDLEKQSGLSKFWFNPNMWAAAQLSENEIIQNKLDVMHYTSPTFWQKPGGQALKIFIGVVIGVAAGFVASLVIGGLVGGLLETFYLSKLVENTSVIHAWASAPEFLDMMLAVGSFIFTGGTGEASLAAGGLWGATAIMVIIGAIVGGLKANDIGEVYDPLKGMPEQVDTQHVDTTGNANDGGAVPVTPAFV